MLKFQEIRCVGYFNTGHFHCSKILSFINVSFLFRMHGDGACINLRIEKRYCDLCHAKYNDLEAASFLDAFVLKVRRKNFLEKKLLSTF